MDSSSPSPSRTSSRCKNGLRFDCSDGASEGNAI